MKYRVCARDLTRLIEEGQLRPGDRLPSVRELARQRALSPVTVQKAYHLLEARGLVAAQPRSGFYVSSRATVNLPRPNSSQPKTRPTPVGKSDFIAEILRSSKSPEVVPLGSAFPSPMLFPLQRLGRSLRRATAKLDPWRSVADLTPGNIELRRQIALRYRLAGVALDADELVITDGAMEALNLCLQAVTRPGDAVLIESPTFYVALQALERLGLEAIEVVTDPQTGIDVDDVARILDSRRPAACWIMSNFQNPTGATMPDAAKQRLVELLAAHRVPLIEDDTYGEIHFGPRRLPPTKAFDRSGGVLHCSSFSKVLAPGYRVGWAAAGQYREQVERLKLGTTLATSLPAQLALADYLSDADIDRHLKEFRLALREGRDAMLQAINNYFPPSCLVTQPDGGYFIWLQLPPGVDGLALHRQALDAGISLMPGELFSPGSDHANAVRLNFGHPDDARILPALRQLGAWVHAQSGSRA